MPMLKQFVKDHYKDEDLKVEDFKLGDISIYTILKRIKQFFDEVNDCFIAIQNNNFSFIKGNFFLCLFKHSLQ